MFAALIPLLLVLGLVVVGHLQAQANVAEPALFRFQAWQLFGLLLIPLLLVSGGMLPLRAATVGFVLLLFAGELARRRRPADVDF